MPHDRFTDNDPTFMKTGVRGLDTLLRGGIHRPPSDTGGLVVLIKGPPGSGKTTLAMQMALAAREWNDLAPEVRTTVDIYTHEQHTDDVDSILRRLDGQDNATDRPTDSPDQTPDEWAPGQGHGASLPPPAAGRSPIDPSHIHGREKSGIGADRAVDSSPSSLAWTRDLVVNLRKGQGERDGRTHRLIVVDGINLVMSTEQHLLEAEKVMGVLRDRAQVGIVVYEPGGRGAQSVDFQADLVIEMKGEVTEGESKYFLQHLRVTKSRFQQSVLGWHQYKIGDDGIHVFPSIHFRIHAGGKDKQGSSKSSALPSIREGLANSYKPITHDWRKGGESEPKGADGSILEYLLGAEALVDGTFTIVLGPRRAWKTLLTFDWLRAGAQRGEVGLLASLMDNEITVAKQREELCKYFCSGRRDGKWDPCERQECYKHIYLYHFRPGCVAPCEFFDYFCKRIEAEGQDAKRPDRFLFWDLMQLEHRFPLLANDPLFLPGIVDYLKHVRQIPSVFMGAPNTELAKTASAIADNVVFCWQDRNSHTNESGWCFYVDRVVSQPEHGKLHFLNEISKGKDGRSAHTSARDLVHAVSTADQVKGSGQAKSRHYKYADSWIEAIREMQGLSLGIRQETYLPIETPELQAPQGTETAEQQAPKSPEQSPGTMRKTLAWLRRRFGSHRSH